MYPILKNELLAQNIYEMEIFAPDIAKAAQAGQFAIAMAEENGERIPLTLADWNLEKGSITLVVMAIGTSTQKIVQQTKELFALAAPLGKPSHIVKEHQKVILVAGGVGAAPLYPIAKAYQELGSHVTIIHGSRNKNLAFWKEKLNSVCHKYIFLTDDGSDGEKGIVTEPLVKLLEKEKYDIIYAIGPVRMMEACCMATKPFEVKTIVSLNTIMIDGTGMCGGCRVTVNQKVKFTCVDGPEFDGHLIDWNNFNQRQKTYHHEEKCSLEKYL